MTRTIDLDWGINAAMERFTKVDSKLIFVSFTVPTAWVCAWRDNRTRIPADAVTYPDLDAALLALGYRPR